MIGVIIGGLIALCSSVLTTFALRRLENARRRHSALGLVLAEVVAIKRQMRASIERCQFPGGI